MSKEWKANWLILLTALTFVPIGLFIAGFNVIPEALVCAHVWALFFGCMASELTR